MRITLITKQGQGRRRWPCPNNIAGGVSAMYPKLRDPCIF